METSFKNYLCSSGVSEAAIAVLEDELVLSMGVFTSLREEHFEKLLPKLKVGEHAALLRLFESSAMRDTETSPTPIFKRVGSGSGSESSSRASSPRFGPSSVRPSPPPSVRLSPPYQQSCTGQSSASKKNFKELAQLYKLKAQQRVGTQSSKREPPKMMMVILGGMVFDQGLHRGIRKKYLPEPNPTKVELSRDTSYSDLLEVAKSHYFTEFEPDHDNLCLADSMGMPIVVANPEKWTIGAFYSSNALQPSRYKLYVMLKSGEPDSDAGQSSAEDKCAHSEQAEPSASTEPSLDPPRKLVQTETVVNTCIDCGRKFRTYVPDTICFLPDGGSVYYREPQTKCPLCDDSGYGGFMNEDLFPELRVGP